MRRVIMLGCCVVCVAAAVAAQQTPIFRAAVDMVQVDVSVLDKDRKPVRGLTAADFTVLEDGKPQKIATFSAVDVPDPPAPLPMGAVTWPREIAPDVQTNALPPEGRLWVMLLDDALLPPDAQIVEAAKRAAASVVNHLNPADQMAIVFTERSRAAQNFTSDHARLLAAVETLQAGRSLYKFGWDTAPNPSSVCPPPVSSDGIPPPCIYLHPQQDSDMAVRVASMRTLEDVADALVALPQRRKVLVYVSPGIPVNASAASAPNLQRDPPPPKSLLAPPPPVPPGATTQMPMMDREAMLTILSGMPALFRQMQRSNVTLYAIDPAGLGGLASFIQRSLSTVLALTWPGQEPVDGGGQVSLGKVPVTMDLAHFETRLALDFLETAANTTGGRAIVNTNDPEPGIDEMFRENGSYYLIGYQATDPGSGKLHRLKVNVDRSDVEVRTRSGYYASEPEPKKPSKASPSAIAMANAISGVLPSADLPMHVSLAPFATPGKATATVAIVLGMSQPAPKEQTVGTVTPQTSAFTADGIGKVSQQQFARVALFGGGPTDVARYEVLSHIDLPPGRYQLRLAAYSSTDRKSGSVYADVDVPDFANLPMSLSGVVLDASPGLTASPRDALATLMPIVPTAERTFDARAQVSAFVKIYEGPKASTDPVTFTVRIVDVAGAPVFEKQDTLDEEDFAGLARTVNKHIPLPLLKCAPGAYLLTIEATMGKTAARRDVRFAIK